MKEELLYKGIIFDLVKAQFPSETKPIIRDVIRHPGGVGVLVIKDGKVLLVSQCRQAINKKTLEIPAGKLEYNEDPKTCGIRELNEETGYECEDFHLFCSFYTTPGFCDEKIYLFEAKNPVKVTDKLEQDENENVSHLWLELDKINAYIEQGKIEDAKTIIALQYALAKGKE